MSIQFESYTRAIEEDEKSQNCKNKSCEKFNATIKKKESKSDRKRNGCSLSRDSYSSK